ncbi:MAG: peptidase M23 [Clostridia bacterium]|nr:MAG: peptidase M23 [Clostridia bacterium]
MRRFFSFLAVLLTAFIFANVLMPMYGSELDDLRRQQQETSRRIQIQKNVIAEKTMEAKSLNQQLQDLDNSITESEDKLAAIRQQLTDAEADVKEAEAQLAQAQRDLEERTQIFTERLRSIYQNGSVSYLEVLLQSTSITDFLVRQGLLQKIAEQDMKLLNEIEARRQDIEARKAALERKRDHIASLEAENTRELANLAGQKEKKQGLLEQALASKEAAERALAEEEEASRQLAAKIKELEARLAKEPFVGGRFAWPLPGHSRITSDFGWRIHPILGGRRFHDGIDIDAPQGTRVIAAADGTVLLAGWYGGYGNAVVISHGGSITTLYGHMSRIGVSEGQRVTRGQEIGRVGTTGLSTGYHLHFGVRKNGEPINPWSYLK